MKVTPVLAPYCVYFALDATGEVLYVGSTDNLPRRFLAHRRLAPWYSQCASVEWTEHQTAEAAHAEEYRQIRGLRPPFNRHGLPKSHAAA